MAIYFRRNDPADLARRLDELAADPDRLRERQEKARSRALNFTSEVMADKYVELYRHLIDRTLPQLTGAGHARPSVAPADTGAQV